VLSTRGRTVRPSRNPSFRHRCAGCRPGPAGAGFLTTGYFGFFLSVFTDFCAFLSLLVSKVRSRHTGDEGDHMKRLRTQIQSWRFWKEEAGQDLIEYALMAGFVAVAAGALMPNVSSSITTVFTKIQTILANAAGS
jgi:Flp pilus assembly pilin Flp